LGKKYSGDAFLAGILEHRHLEGILETLHVQADADGRVRCAYNVVGTETGRFSCKTSPTGAGTNMTTITKKLRHNYVAD
jgi:DNA polymerase I-like protein with 3'-5' exonuclease and polymerase domains